MNLLYYMAGSTSGQDGPILRARVCPLCSHKSKILWCKSFGHILSPLVTKLVWSRWRDVGLILFFAFLWTSTAAFATRIQKKNLANIQQPWPCAWSVMHTRYIRPSLGLPRMFSGTTQIFGFNGTSLSPLFIVKYLPREHKLY